jgi:hypothetical protein
MHTLFWSAIITRLTGTNAFTFIITEFEIAVTLDTHCAFEVSVQEMMSPFAGVKV